MTRHRLYYEEPKNVRNSLRKVREISLQIHALEKDLVILLSEIDKKRFYVRLGFKSLRSFCCYGLFFGRTQSQRIVTSVRRLDPNALCVDPNALSVAASALRVDPNASPADSNVQRLETTVNIGQTHEE